MAAVLGIGVRSLRTLERGEIPARLGSSVLVRASRYFHVSADGLLSPMEK